MPKIRANLASQLTVSASTATQPIITAPLTDTAQELSPNHTSQESQIPSISAPREALQQILPKTGKSTRKIPKYYKFEQEDSFGVSTNWCPPNWLQSRRKPRKGNIESLQPSVVQLIIDTTAQVEPIPNPYPSPVIGMELPTDQHIRLADQSPDET